MCHIQCNAFLGYKYLRVFQVSTLSYKHLDFVVLTVTCSPMEFVTNNHFIIF